MVTIQLPLTEGELLGPRTMVLDPPLTDEEFVVFCGQSEWFKIERREDGTIVMNVPAGGETGAAEAEIVMQLRNWWRTQNGKRGQVFGPSAEFFLPDGSGLNPDAAYVTEEQWAGQSKQNKVGFPYLCPVFVIELLSPADRLKAAQDKMERWIKNGALLAWLIVPKAHQVIVCKPDDEPETVTSLKIPGMEGFVLDLQAVWECYE